MHLTSLVNIMKLSITCILTLCILTKCVDRWIGIKQQWKSGKPIVCHRDCTILLLLCVNLAFQQLILFSFVFCIIYNQDVRTNCLWLSYSSFHLSNN